MPIPEITRERSGASAVILSDVEGECPTYPGLEIAAAYPKSDLRIFGKSTARPYRRMGVALAYDEVNANVKAIVERAKEMAAQVKVVVE